MKITIAENAILSLDINRDIFGEIEVLGIFSPSNGDGSYPVAKSEVEAYISLFNEPQTYWTDGDIIVGNKTLKNCYVIVFRRVT